MTQVSIFPTHQNFILTHSISYRPSNFRILLSWLTCPFYSKLPPRANAHLDLNCHCKPNLCSPQIVDPLYDLLEKSILYTLRLIDCQGARIAGWPQWNLHIGFCSVLPHSCESPLHPTSARLSKRMNFFCSLFDSALLNITVYSIPS